MFSIYIVLGTKASHHPAKSSARLIPVEWPEPSFVDLYHSHIPVLTVCLITGKSLAAYAGLVLDLLRYQWSVIAVKCLSPKGQTRRRSEEYYDASCLGGVLRRVPNDAGEYLSMVEKWSKRLAHQSPSILSGSSKIPQTATYNWIRNCGDYINHTSLNALVASIVSARRPFYRRTWFGVYWATLAASA